MILRWRRRLLLLSLPVEIILGLLRGKGNDAVKEANKSDVEGKSRAKLIRHLVELIYLRDDAVAMTAAKKAFLSIPIATAQLK